MILRACACGWRARIDPRAREVRSLSESRMTTSLPPEDLLPVLVADLADDESRDILEAAAFAGSRVYIPLETAPVSASRHVLEVYFPSIDEPILFLALPLGPPTEDGVPPQIQAMPDSR